MLPELAEESEGEDAFPAEVVSLFAVSFVPCCPDEEAFALPLLPVCVAVLPVPAVFDVPEEEAAPAVPVVLADGAFDEANARVFCLDALAEEGEPEEVTEEAAISGGVVEINQQRVRILIDEAEQSCASSRPRATRF